MAYMELGHVNYSSTHISVAIFGMENRLIRVGMSMVSLNFTLWRFVTLRCVIGPVDAFNAYSKS